MEKNLLEYFLSKKFKVENNNAFGFYKGYQVNVNVNILERKNPVIFTFGSFLTDEQKDLIIKELITKAIKFADYSFNNFGLCIGLNDLTIKKLIVRLDDILNTVVEVLIHNEAKGLGYCPVCGVELTEENKKECEFGKFRFDMDLDCAEKQSALIRQHNYKYRTAPNNYLKGICGAILGAIIGGILAYILLLFNFISAISSFVSIALGALLYRKFGGKQNAMMIIVPTILTILVSLFLLYVTYLGAGIIALGDSYINYSNSEIIKNLFNTNPEYRGYFYQDLGTTLLFTFIGAGYEIYRLVKVVKGQIIK